MEEIMTLKPDFEFHVQIFSRGKWITVHATKDLVIAEQLCIQNALRSLERWRILRVDYSPINVYCYAR